MGLVGCVLDLSRVGRVMHVDGGILNRLDTQQQLPGAPCLGNTVVYDVPSMLNQKRSHFQWCKKKEEKVFRFTLFFHIRLLDLGSVCICFPVVE